MGTGECFSHSNLLSEKVEKPKLTSLRSEVFMFQSGIGRGQKTKRACMSSGSFLISLAAGLSSFCVRYIRRTEALPSCALGSDATHTSGLTNHAISSGRRSTGRRNASAYRSHHRHAGSRQHHLITARAAAPRQFAPLCPGDQSSSALKMVSRTKAGVLGSCPDRKPCCN